MNYLLIAIVVVLFVVVTVMLMIFLPKPQCFYVPIDVCKDLLLFNKDDHAITVFKELINIKENTPIYNIVDNKINDNMRDWPMFETLLHSIPDLQRVSVSIIPARHTENAIQNEQYNTLFRCIFPLETPVKKAGIWCDGERKLFKQYEWVIYDPSKKHYFFNEVKRGNAKLIVIDITNTCAALEDM